MNLLNCLIMAVSAFAVLTMISFLLGFLKRDDEENRRRYWKMSCVFGGLTIVAGVLMLLVLLPLFLN